jgi:hypothetical protein
MASSNHPHWQANTTTRRVRNCNPKPRRTKEIPALNQHQLQTVSAVLEYSPIDPPLAREGTKNIFVAED